MNAEASTRVAGWPRGAVQLSTETVDQRDRFDYWHDVICRIYVNLEARPIAGDDGPVGRAGLNRGAGFGGEVTGLSAGPGSRNVGAVP